MENKLTGKTMYEGGSHHVRRITSTKDDMPFKTYDYRGTFTGLGTRILKGQEKETETKSVVRGPAHGCAAWRYTLAPLDAF